MENKNFRYVVGIDPSIRTTGVAILSKNWEEYLLYRAELVRTPKTPIPEVLVEICLKVAAIVDPLGDGSEVLFVLEKPRLYRGRAKKGDPNDLINVAEVVGALSVFALNWKSRVMQPTPSEWNGGRDKDVTEARCRATLSKEEIASMSLPKGKKDAQNVWDACGLALWGAKQLGFRRKGLLSVSG